MNKQAFEHGFIKAAMSEGLSHAEAAALYKVANGDSWNFLKETMQQPGYSDAALNNALIGGGIGALGGGALGALSADEEKGQSKWKRGFGGALLGGGLGGLAGGGMKINDQFNQTKADVGQGLVGQGRSYLDALQGDGTLPPEVQSQLLQRLRETRQLGEQVRGVTMPDALLQPRQMIKDYFNGELVNSQDIRR